MTKEEFLKSCLDETENKINVLATYENGNHYECIFEDGTKIKDTINQNDDHFTYSFPTNFDFKINNRCDGGCKYCHENSTVNGSVPELMPLVDTNFFKSLHAGTEIAIGGGNIFESKDLIPFLRALKEKGIIANVTINQKHFFPNLDRITSMIKQGLVHGIGVSLVDSSDKSFIESLRFLRKNKLDENLVIHVINGILTQKDIPILIGQKILILGYKDLRRGHSLLESSWPEIIRNQKWLKSNLKQLSNLTRVMSFDCLGIEQLEPKEVLGISDDEYDSIFQGADTDVRDADGNITCATMYIDLPNMQVGRMSTAPLDKRIQFNTDETIEDLFKKSIIGW